MPDTAMSVPTPAITEFERALPCSPDVTTGAAADLHACENLMRGGSKSFFAASRVLPARVRTPAIALYAFCRVADDAIDLAHDPAAAVERLDSRLNAIFEQRPQPFEADRALAAVVAQFRLPRGLLDALIEGFRWDCEGRRYDTIEQLEDYCARVAGSVGAMMAILMGTRRHAPLARACELGVAMQLTNIARDVGEDARNGRLYLPREWLYEEGIDPDAWLRDPVFRPEIGRVVARLLACADRLYERSALGIAELPRDCRPAIQAARLVYAEIGREVERARLDSVSGRAIVSSQRKAWLMTRSLLARVRLDRPDREATANRAPAMVEAVRYLVDLAVEPTSMVPPQARVSPDSFYRRTIRVIEISERVRMRARLNPGAAQT